MSSLGARVAVSRRTLDGTMSTLEIKAHIAAMFAEPAPLGVELPTLGAAGERESL